MGRARLGVATGYGGRLAAAPAIVTRRFGHAPAKVGREVGPALRNGQGSVACGDPPAIGNNATRSRRLCPLLIAYCRLPSAHCPPAFSP